MLNLAVLSVAFLAIQGSPHIGNHPARFSAEGRLLPWLPIRQVLDREMAWYEKCPDLHGYPAHVVLTFMDGKYQKVARRDDSIPDMQCATGILSYLNYDRLSGQRYPWVLARAKMFADYILRNANTGLAGEWPMFPRSTGIAGAVPQPSDCGRQADHPYEVEPDKGALFAYALLKLYHRTSDHAYFDFARQIAQTLVLHMHPGDATHSPWPFRVDFRTGAERGPVSADMGYPVALFDELTQLGVTEFEEPKAKVWKWIHDFQIPSLAKDGQLWVNFFEDYDLATNRNSWSATNLARILMDRKERIDPDWRTDTGKLLSFVMENFTSVRLGVPVCGEQDDDKDPWGGALSNYGSAMAQYAKLTHRPDLKYLANQAIVFASYAVDNDGCPGQSAEYSIRGGWQEDAHTDVVRNLVDALEAFPDWQRAR